MRRIHFFVAALLAVTPWPPPTAFATPNPNSAIFHLRVWNDCPTSTLSYGSTYPTNVYIHDQPDCTSGYANLHVWRLSEDGVNPAVFHNADSFSIAADCSLNGTSNGETGLDCSPWWAQDTDGRFNIRIPDGEIACFGGRLPFFSFTATYGITYTVWHHHPSDHDLSTARPHTAKPWDHGVPG